MAKKTPQTKPKGEPKVEKRSQIGDSEKSYENLRKAAEIPPKKKEK